MTRDDHWYKNQMRISCRSLAAVIGMTESAVKSAMVYKMSPQRMLDRIARLIPAIEERRLIFPWQRFIWGAQPLPFFIWLDLPADIPRLGMLAAESAWTIFSRCRACGGNKWLPVLIDGKSHVACYQCLPPTQWPSIGAVGATKRLIAEACRKL